MPADAPSEMTVDADGLVLIVRFHLIKFWELDARRALAMNSESLIPFIPLMDGKKEDTIQGLRELSAIADELRRRELAVHFLFLGSLRYSLEEVFEMIERYGMVPIDKLKESPAYQFILSTGIEQGIEKGRRALEEVLLDLIEKRFPGFELKAEIDCVHDIEALTQLCFKVDQIADANELRARVHELAIEK